MSHNVETLRALLVEPNCQTEGRNVADPRMQSAKQEKTATPDLLSKVVCDSDDSRRVVQTLMGGKAELRKEQPADVTSDPGPAETVERECLMSLDITECELQMLERQAKEELISEMTAASEVKV